MKKILLICALISLSFNLVNAQGLKLSSKEDLKDVEVWVKGDQGFTEKIPSSFSMENYCPPPLSQGADGTCVGYSICYSAISIMYNYQMGITDPFLKYALAFDPYFMYSALKMNMDVDCQEGLNMRTAMNFLYEKGVKRWAMMPYLDCRHEWESKEWSFVQYYAQPFALVNYSLVESMADAKVLIGNGYPVVIGVSMGKSIYSNTEVNGTVGSDGLWTPKANEELVGGHALTLIGYDDYKFGGAFKVMNSWGSKYGDNGFIWIRYKDYPVVVKEAWVMAPKVLEADKKEVTINTDYYGRFVFETGNVYEGMYLDNNFHGVGFFQWTDGDIYFGFWENGKRNGPGIFFNYKNQDYLKVYYENDMFVKDDGQGFAGDSKTSQLNSYLEKFKIDIKETESDPDFEMPDMGSTKIIK
jgi:hypothetical protein